MFDIKNRSLCYFKIFYSISVWYSSKYISTIIAQHYGNCDYFNQIQVGTIYTIRSPNYPSKYAPGTFCRYTCKYIMYIIEMIFYFNF